MVWAAIWVVGVIYFLGSSWRDIIESFRDNGPRAAFPLLVMAAIWTPVSMLFAYALVWVRGLDIPPPP